MRSCLYLALCVFLAGGVLLLGSVPAWSVLIETAPKTRVGGYWVSEDAKQISVRIKLPGGKEKIEVFSRAKIKVIHKVDRDRLEKLTKDEPTAYRDYAEELAVHKADPEAVELATRLWLIAAYLDPAKLGPTCLLRMSALADHPADVRKYRAMAFVLDAKADRSLLQSAKVEKKAPSKELQYFQKALRQYRNGQFSEAQSNAQVAGVAAYFGLAPGTLNQKDFIQACKDALVTKSVAEDHMEAILRAEIWALDQGLMTTPSPKKDREGTSWSRALSSAEMAPVPLLTLETIAPYDPRQCVFRNGAWAAP